MTKTRRIANFVLPLLFVACFSSGVSAAPYGPNGREIKWTQPGGEPMELRVFGDEFYARTETRGGYTVVFNPQDRAYYYARLAADGKTLEPSATLAHRPVPQGLGKHLDRPVEQIRNISQANSNKYTGDWKNRWSQRVKARQTLATARKEGRLLQGPEAAAAASAAAPVVGSKLGLTILVEFQDVKFPVSQDKIVDYCNKEGYTEDGNTGSVRDYFFDQSIGKLTYTQKVTTIVTLPETWDFYNNQGDEAGRRMITDAVTILKNQGFDFTGLSVDAQRNALATNLFWAGEDSGVWAQGLWPHSWELAAPLSVGTAAEPIFLFNYQVTNIPDTAPVIGTFIHENGHLLLGYPDLYSYVGQGEGVGNHCIMAAGNYNNDGKTPAPINGYFKDIMGWENVTDIVGSVLHTLPASGNFGFRYVNPGTSTEYFFVENRGGNDKWAEYAQDKGILIWHIDETIEGNSNRFMTDPHYGVALEQADGKQDLENGQNRGDEKDAFDLATPKFTDATTPNAHWWDDLESGFDAKVLDDPQNDVRVIFGGVPVNTLTVTTPKGGEVTYRSSDFPIYWISNIVGNVRIELYRNGVFNRLIALDAPNTGSYIWKVPANIAALRGYSIRVSSISNPVPVFDFSEGTFSISSYTFPSDGTWPIGWYKPKDCEYSWVLTTFTPYEGSHCLVTEPMPDKVTAGVAYSATFMAGEVSFFLKASTELDFDYVRFYIDGTQQTLSTGASKGLSGEVPWTQFTFPLPAGKHTLKWLYVKDDSFPSGKDRAKLDLVRLPPTTEDIAVAGPAGNPLVSDRGVVRFEDKYVGYESKPRTYTISNVGTSILYKLKVVSRGANRLSFVAGAPGLTTLKPGQSTTFPITFAPAAPGLQIAEIHIESTDADENPFIINVEGLGKGVPKIAVSQPLGFPLKNNVSTTNFGKCVVGKTGAVKTYSVKNVGDGNLTQLAASSSGAARADFKIGPMGVTKLAPGESTTFKVTFMPSAANVRSATLHITFNPKVGGTFNVNLLGTGVAKTSSAVGNSHFGLVDAVFGSSASDDAGPAKSVTSLEVVDGRKYLALTVAKPAVRDGLTRTVEVSPNLVDWFSGWKHTTVISDNEVFLKVRDNTPVTPGAKRYIRLKTTH